MQEADSVMKYVKTNTVGVRFENNPKTYSYFVPDGDSPKVGDIVITNVFKLLNSEEYRVRIGEGMLKCARVTVIETYPNIKATKFYLQLVSIDYLEARVKFNEVAMKRVAERRNIIEQLDSLLLEQSKVEHYRRLAADNPSARALLESLEKL